MSSYNANHGCPDFTCNGRMMVFGDPLILVLKARTYRPCMQSV